MGEPLVRLEYPLHEAALAVGVVTVREYDARTGRLLDEIVRRNVLTLAGKRAWCELLFGIVTPVIAGVAFGDNNTPATKTDATLYSENIRLPLTSFGPTATDDGTSGKMTAVCVMGSTQGNGFTYRELSFVRSLTAGAADLFNRVVIPDKAKTSSKILTAQLDLTLT